MVERLVANEKVEVQVPLPAPKKMSDLVNKKCIPCEGNIPPFDKSEIHKYLKGQRMGSKTIKIKVFSDKEFSFKNFSESQNFVNKVGNIAEQENHHPDISFGWGYCKIKMFIAQLKVWLKVILS